MKLASYTQTPIGQSLLHISSWITKVDNYGREDPTYKNIDNEIFLTWMWPQVVDLVYFCWRGSDALDFCVGGRCDVTADVTKRHAGVVGTEALPSDDDCCTS